MPINTTHEDYAEASGDWQTCRDAIKGEKAIKKAGERYLPKLGGQTDKEYHAYLQRAYYFNATGRTHEAMVGTVFRVDPTVSPEFPDDRLLDLAESAVKEVAAVGRCGLLVDAPIGGGDPYLAMYKAEDIVNWRSTKVGDAEVITLVVLRECAEMPDPDDPYVIEKKPQYRELFLDDVGNYAQQLWVETTKNEFAKDGDPIYPEAAGKKLTAIPFVIISPNGVATEVQDPPMMDLVNVNLSHFRSVADLEHGRHFTALPTAWVAGFETMNADGSERELRIGAGTAWVTDNVNASAGFLEFTGQGLKALETATEQKESQMAMLGTQLFTTGQAETATAAKIHRAQQTASLTSIANSVSKGMSLAYQFYLSFSRVTTEAIFKLSTDFMPETLDPQMLTTLVSSYQQGAMSLETLLWNLKQGELLPPDITPEDELVRIVAGFNNLSQGGV